MTSPQLGNASGNTRGGTLAAHTDRVEPLTGRLPSMPADVAALHRTVFDRRFEPWLRAAFKNAQLRIEQRDDVGSDEPHGIAVGLRCSAGRASAILDAQRWAPLATLEALLRTPAGHEVATALFDSLLRSAAPASLALPGLEVESVDRAEARASRWPQPVLYVQGRPIRLGTIDPGLALHLAAAMRGSATSLATLAGLRVPARLLLASRPYMLSVLHTLAPGDMVLVGRTASQPAWWLAGTGVCLAALAKLDWDSSALRLTTAPRLRDLDAQPLTETTTMTASLADLQVGVAFEIDTARLTLDELSGMASGCVIAMDVPLEHAAVRIVCQGQHVGEGQLVAIGEHLGVRIERMHWNGHAGL